MNRHECASSNILKKHFRGAANRLHKAYLLACLEVSGVHGIVPQGPPTDHRSRLIKLLIENRTGFVVYTRTRVRRDLPKLATMMQKTAIEWNKDKGHKTPEMVEYAKIMCALLGPTGMSIDPRPITSSVLTLTSAISLQRTSLGPIGSTSTAVLEELHQKQTSPQLPSFPRKRRRVSKARRWGWILASSATLCSRMRCFEAL
jgi:hypothetical protein